MPKARLDIRYLITLLVVATLILVGGWAIRPRDDLQPIVSLPTVSELAGLTRLTQRRSLESMSQYFRGVADGVDASLVRVSNTTATGIVWNRERVLTVRLNHPVPPEVTLARARDSAVARVALWGPDLPFVSIGVPAVMAGLAPVLHASAPPAPGSWVVSVWNADTGRLFTPATYQQTVPAMCGDVEVREVVTSGGVSATMAGAGVFNLDGRLLAMVLPCGDRVAAITGASIDRLLFDAERVERRLLALYGLTAETPTDADRQYFSIESGLVVREVWDGHPGDAAGLRPGDVILAIDGAEVSDPIGLAGVLAMHQSQEFQLTVQRGTMQFALSLPSHSDEFGTTGTESGDLGGVVANELTVEDEALASGDVAEAALVDRSPVAGVVLESAFRGYRVASVLSDSPAAVAGILAGDRLLRINHEEPADSTQVRRVLEDSDMPAAFVEFQRGRRRFGVLFE